MNDAFVQMQLLGWPRNTPLAVCITRQSWLYVCGCRHTGKYGEPPKLGEVEPTPWDVWCGWPLQASPSPCAL